jgi:hypothetical protein
MSTSKTTRRNDDEHEDAPPGWYVNLEAAIAAIWGIWGICGAHVYRVRLPGRGINVPVVVWRGGDRPCLLDDPLGKPADRKAAHEMRMQLLSELEGGGVMMTERTLRDALALAPKEHEQWAA